MLLLPLRASALGPLQLASEGKRTHHVRHLGSHRERSAAFSGCLALTAFVASQSRQRVTCHARDVADPRRRRRRLRDLKVGQKLSGTVKEVLASHALVDVGAEFDAVLHASKMAQGNQNPADVVFEGMEIEVWVSGMRSEGYGMKQNSTWKIDAKLEVTMLDPKELSADVSEFSSLPSDALLAATVSRIEDYGIFVLVQRPSGGAPVQGFVHVSEMKEGFVNHPEDEVEMGQGLTVRLLRVDRKFGRLRLSMKLPDVEGY